ncbi:hypothetical protein K474DRAFT_1664920 [Panus rudis PR-1116 ss-1]|nr:hypothetical protein K474DRAFT_1664920 [Panus rudis PR-1116 ss-1]
MDLQQRNGTVEALKSELNKLCVTRANLVKQVEDIDKEVFEISLNLSRHNLIHYLPDEILSLIFTFAVQTLPYKCLPCPSIDISHVCKRWRAVAINTSQLWTNILLTGAESVDHLMRYLERSKARPLRIMLNFTAERPKPWQHFLREDWDRFQTYLAPLYHHTHRWQFFGVYTNHIPIVTRILDRLNTLTAPILEQVVLCLDNHQGAGIPPPHTISIRAPLLTSLHTTNIRLRCPGITANLKHLFIGHRSAVFTVNRKALRRLFALSPNLEAVALSHIRYAPHESTVDDEEGNESSDPGVNIQASSLRDLRLDSVSSMHTLLEELNAPALMRLEIANLTEVQFDDFTEAMARLRFPTVTELAFTRIKVSTDMSLPAALAKNFPAVQTLALIGTDATPFIWLLIDPDKQSPPIQFLPFGPFHFLHFWPNVTTLYISKMSEDASLLRELLQTRFLSLHPQSPIAKRVSHIFVEESMVLPYGVVSALQLAGVSLGSFIAPEHVFDDLRSPSGPNARSRHPKWLNPDCACNS